MAEKDRGLFAFAGFVFDSQTGELTTESGLRVRINRQIADLLSLLIRHPGQLVTRGQIKDALWPGRELLNHEKVITNGISRLRFLLNDNPAQPRYIESIPKRGYRLVVEVRQIETPRPVHIEKPELTLVNDASSTLLSSAASSLRRGKSGFRQWSLVAAGILVGTFVSYFALHREPRRPLITSLGIAPFEASGEGADALASSFRLDLTDALSQLPQVRVRAAHSLDMLHLSQATLRGEAPRLGLDAILFGRLLSDGDRYHLQFELVSGKDGNHIATYQYSGTRAELASIRDKIQMATFSQLKLSGSLLQAPLGGTSNPEAYSLYLAARYHFSQQTADSLRLSLSEYKAAISQDPDFAKAYAGEANTYIFLWQHNVISQDEGFRGATAAAQKALSLDRSSADAHAALGVVDFLHNWNLQAGESELEQALRLDPEQPIFRQWLSLVLCDEGRFQESFHELDQAHIEDPLWISAYVTEAHVASEAKDHVRMVESARKLKELMPESPHVRDAIANVDWADGRFTEAIAEWRIMAVMEGDADRVLLEDHGLEALHRGGIRAYARVRLQAIGTRTGTARHPNDFDLPIWYAVAGEPSKALIAIRNAIAQHDPDVLQLSVLPPFECLHGEPKFLAMLKQVGLSLPPKSSGSAFPPKINK